MWILQLSWLSGIGQKAFFGFCPDTTVDPNTLAPIVIIFLPEPSLYFFCSITITLLNDYTYNNPNEQ